VERSEQLLKQLLALCAGVSLNEASSAENGRCRMHGGSSPGAPRGEANGNYRHGRFTCEAIAERRQLAAWLRMIGQLAQEV